MQSFKVNKGQAIKPFKFQGQLNEEAWWLIVSKEELLKYQEIFKWQIQTVKACMDMSKMPQVEAYEKYDFGILQRLVWINHQLTTKAFCFYISREYLVIVKDKESRWLDDFCQSLLKDTEEKYSIDYIFFRLLDNVIQSDQSYLDHLLNQIVELEENVFRNQASYFSKEIIEIRKHIALLKRHYDPLTDVIEDFVSNDNEICSDEVIRYFKILKNRMKRLNHQVDQMSEYTNHVREAYDAQVEIKQNQIMQYFTLLTSIFLPLTLITGWYGMNFENVPELSWKYGYLYVISLSIICSILCVYFFKKNRWM